ncbi:unnamed protein product, partial [Brassica oleracea]
MVCVRLVDSPDSPEEHPPPPIPEMMFAVGEEPVGVRVLTYLTSGAINRIFNALEEEEVQIIRRSAFGKILEIVEVVTVAAVIKMLRRRTVEDRVVRIKFACLAILSSVLLPT